MTTAEHKPLVLPAASINHAQAAADADAKLVPFYSPEEEPTYGRPIHVALRSGHTAIVYGLAATDGKGTPLHPRYHREAVKQGALPLGAQAYQQTEEKAEPTRDEVIRKAMEEMVDGDEDADFTREGKPDLNQLMRRCGFRIAREEADKIWAALDIKPPLRTQPIAD